MQLASIFPAADKNGRWRHARLRAEADHQPLKDVNGHSSHFGRDGIAAQVVLIKISPL